MTCNPGMVMPNSNTWLSDEGHAQVDWFLSEADEFIVERRWVLNLIGKICGWHFANPEGLALLDFGCGDGIVSWTIARQFPSNNFHLLDGAPEMLASAREKMQQYDVEYIESTFEYFLQNSPVDQSYDFIYSSMAIHHLDFVDKVRLFNRFYRELKFGGLFLNFDIVLPASLTTERWQHQMWRDCMNDKLCQDGHPESAGKHDALPELAKNKPENKPTRLGDQLGALQQVGFNDVDCFYKNGLFCLFGGIKS
jgi:tRNA (cmo5U34)-methyltransferase